MAQRGELSAAKEYILQQRMPRPGDIHGEIFILFFAQEKNYLYTTDFH